jgi:hypothetical protein
MSSTVDRVPLTLRTLALREELRTAARQYGSSLVRLAARTALLRWQRGFGPREALFEGLLDPALPRERWALAIPKHRLLHLQKPFNPSQHLVLTEDKVLFDAYCRRLELPVPRTLAVLRRPSGWKTDGRPLSALADWAAFFERELPAEFVAKPADGFWGLGVRAFDREGDGFREAAGRVFSAAELAAELVAAAPGTRPLVLQERLHNHRTIAALSGSAGLQTIRMVTLVHDDGSAGLYLSLMRIIGGDAVVDNFKSGRGNLAALVDPASGVLDRATSWRPPTVGPVYFTDHPRTGARIPGFALPCYEEACELVLRAARLFLPLRTIGWDVAVTPTGPVLVEGNACWDPVSWVFMATGSEEAHRRWKLLLDTLEARDG